MSLDIVQVRYPFQSPRSQYPVSPDIVKTPIVVPAQVVAYEQILLLLPRTPPYLPPASLLSAQQEVVRKAEAEEEVFQQVHLFQENKVAVGQHALAILPQWSKV